MKVAFDGFWKHVVLVTIGVAIFVYAGVFLGGQPETMGMFLAGGGLCLAAGDPRKLLKLGKTELAIWQHAVLLALGALCVVIGVNLHAGMLVRGPILVAAGGSLLAGDPFHLFAGLIGSDSDEAPPGPPATGTGAA